jgi:ribonuclease HI
MHDFINDASQLDRSGSAVLEYILRLEDNSIEGFQNINLKEVVSVCCWYLWWIRRRRTHNEDVPPLYKCKLSILSITTNAARASKTRPDGLAVKWVRPRPRQVKLNVDASFHEDTKDGAAGAILRDYKGDFIAASMKYIPHVASASMAEAMAMKEGLCLAQRMGCNNLLAESDSTDIIEACSGEEAWWSESSAIFADCIDQVASIGTVSFAHCPREANKVAHGLAQECFSSKVSCNWVDEPPQFILDAILNDVTIL